MKDNSVSIWADRNDQNIIIGNEYCDENDLVIIVPLTQNNILEWIKVLLRMLEDGDVCDVPGSVERVVKIEEV